MNFKIITSFVWICALVIGASLFWTSKQVQNAEREKRSLQAAISVERERTSVLTAEWHYLNNPARLEKLAMQYFTAPEPAETKDKAVILAGTLQLPDTPMRPVAKPPVPARYLDGQPQEQTMQVAQAEPEPAPAAAQAEPTKTTRNFPQAAMKASPSNTPSSQTAYDHSNRNQFNTMLASYTGGR